MADVYVNALTTISTEPSSTDSLVVVNRNTNEGKIIDYELLADKILAKLTSKTFSGLNTTSKNLVGAINEQGLDLFTLNQNYTDLIRVKAYTYGYTINANGNLAVTGVDLGITAISGYSPIGLADYTTGSNNVLVRGIYGQNISGNILIMHNITDSSLNATVSVTQLYVRTSAFAAS